MDWFSEQQVRILTRGRYEAHRKLEDRVLDLLDDRWERQQADYVTPRLVQKAGIVRTAEEAKALLARMASDSVLVPAEHRRPEGGHVEIQYRRRIVRGPSTR